MLITDYPGPLKHLIHGNSWKEDADHRRHFIASLSLYARRIKSRQTSWLIEQSRRRRQKSIVRLIR